MLGGNLGSLLYGDVSLMFGGITLLFNVHVYLVGIFSRLITAFLGMPEFLECLR